MLVLLHAQALTDKSSDHLLDVLEPDRTRLMARVAEAREVIRKVVEKRR